MSSSVLVMYEELCLEKFSGEGDINFQGICPAGIFMRLSGVCIGIPMQDYNSLNLVVTVWTIKVHIHTDRQRDDGFWPLCKISSAPAKQAPEVSK